MCTGARCIDIEWEAAYVDWAQRCAHTLGLTHVTFTSISQHGVLSVHAVHRRDVLNMLKAEAAKRSIRICTLGPCTPTVAREGWPRPPASTKSIGQPCSAASKRSSCTRKAKRPQRKMPVSLADWHRIQNHGFVDGTGSLSGGQYETRYIRFLLILILVFALSCSSSSRVASEP